MKMVILLIQSEFVTNLNHSMQTLKTHRRFRLAVGQCILRLMMGRNDDKVVFPSSPSRAQWV